MDLFVSLAEIAGVFVAFGALIGLVRSESFEEHDLHRIRGLVSIGLLVLAASLYPVALERYGLSDRVLWGFASALFVGSIWFSNLFPLVWEPTRKTARGLWKSSPLPTWLIWIFLEVPVQGLLLLVVLGIQVELAPAFYTTALVLSLFKAAALLGQVLFSNVGMR